MKTTKFTYTHPDEIVIIGNEEREQPRDKLGQFASTNGGAESSVEASASEKPLSVEDVKLKKDPSIKPYSDGTGDQAGWDVTDSQGTQVGTIRLVKERKPIYVGNGQGYLWDRGRSLQASRATSTKEQAIKDLVKSHNEILKINAET
jgi:hypothetical protein